MPADFTELEQEFQTALVQVARAQGVQASAKTMITGFAAALDAKLTAALLADNAADGNTIKVMKETLAAALAPFTASTTELEDAIAANTPPAPIEPPVVPPVEPPAPPIDSPAEPPV